MPYSSDNQLSIAPMITELDNLFAAMETLGVLCTSIKTYGLEPQLRAIVASTEGISQFKDSPLEELCVGIENFVSAIWTKVQELWARFVAWLKQVFSRRKELGFTAANIQKDIANLKQLQADLSTITESDYKKVLDDGIERGKTSWRMNDPWINKTQLSTLIAHAEQTTEFYNKTFPLSKFDEMLAATRKFTHCVNNKEDVTAATEEVRKISEYFDTHIPEIDQLEERQSAECKAMATNDNVGHVEKVIPTLASCKALVADLIELSTKTLPIAVSEEADENAMYRISTELRSLISPADDKWRWYDENGVLRITDSVKQVEHAFRGVMRVIAKECRPTAALHASIVCRMHYRDLREFVDTLKNAQHPAVTPGD